MGYVFSEVEGWAKGGEGAIDIAKKIIDITDLKKSYINYSYELNETIQEKIYNIC